MAFAPLKGMVLISARPMVWTCRYQYLYDNRPRTRPNVLCTLFSKEAT